MYFQNHHERALHERALLVLEVSVQECHYLSGTFSISRFNRRLHKCRAWLEVVTEVLCEVAQRSEVFKLQSQSEPDGSGRESKNLIVIGDFGCLCSAAAIL
jgi:hypothetical protein